MKKGILALLLLAAAAVGQADGKYLRRKTEDKYRSKDITFALTFDNLHVNADFARGRKESLTQKDANLALRGAVGFDGARAYAAIPGEELKYSALHNIDPCNGTISLWLNARDFDPRTDSGRGNMVIWNHRLSDGKRWIDFLLYEYRGSIWADWRSSEEPHTYTDTCSLTIKTAMTEIRKNEFFQLVYTWKDSREVSLFLNGRKIMTKQLPVKSAKTADLKIKDSASWISFRPNMLNDRKTDALDVDDILIFNRALSELEVANRYAALLADKSDAKAKPHLFTVKLNGVDLGGGKGLDRLEAEFDLSGIAAERRKTGLTFDYALTGPGGLNRTGQWNFSGAETVKFLDGIAAPGKYTLTVSCGQEKAVAEIIRPDLSFIGNGIGAEDAVPALWRDFKVDGRKITLWNRRYFFGPGPFPEKILIRNQELLTAAPALCINGQQVDQWRPGGTQTGNSYAVYSGTGQFKGGTLTYRTRVEFDGFIRCDFTISGRPVINRMCLKWQVAKPFTQYLMTPELYQKTNKTPSFNLNYDSRRAKQLWFVAEKKGGFCWSFEHDANWIYRPADNMLFADLNTGSCRVEMIRKAVKLPEDTPYHALFIATPTRPLPAKIRNMRAGNGEPGIVLLHGMQGCFTGPTNFEPHPVEFARLMNRDKNRRFAANGLANSMTAADPAAVYFEKYGGRPGASNYNIPFGQYVDGKLKMSYPRTVAACNRNSFVNDLFLWNIRKLFAADANGQIAQIYYDLCGNGLCTNPLHGCRFQDRFGRWINSREILGMRDLIIRTVRYAHSMGRTVWLHGQRDFNPILQGDADYWFPGEEHTALFMRNPYASTDEIPDAVYRSEFNRNVRGVGILAAPMVHFRNAQKQVRPSEAYMGMMLLHDIDVYAWDHINHSVIHKVNLILHRLRCGDQAVPHLFYEQREVRSSEPDLECTWYDCPGGEKMLVVMNRTPRSRAGTIDASRISSFSGPAVSEYFGDKISVKRGVFTLRVTPRSFRIIALKGK